jgi:hypothetical protein
LGVGARPGVGPAARTASVARPHRRRVWFMGPYAGCCRLQPGSGQLSACCVAETSDGGAWAQVPSDLTIELLPG